MVGAGIAACGVTLGDVPFTTSSALLLVMITLVPAAIMLVLWRAAPAPAPVRPWAASAAAFDSRSRGYPPTR
jgi:hypothetical protein